MGASESQPFIPDVNARQQQHNEIHSRITQLCQTRYKFDAELVAIVKHPTFQLENKECFQRFQNNRAQVHVLNLELSMLQTHLDSLGLCGTRAELPSICN
jgi:hypothetical protein